MRLLLMFLVAACGGSAVVPSGEPGPPLPVPVTQLPSGWNSWDAGVPESVDEPSTPACGHECPGATLTLLVGECPSTSTSDGGSVVISIDWSNCSSTPAWKNCYCTDPRNDPSVGEITFRISTDETKCVAARELWKTACN